MVARDAEAGRLIIGHFSARIQDEEALLNEAKTIFPNTILASRSSLSSMSVISSLLRDSSLAKCVPMAYAPAMIIFISLLLL